MRGCGPQRVEDNGCDERVPVDARTPASSSLAWLARKSTLAVALAAKTGLPIVHLDLYFWRPGWVAPSETEWRENQRVALAGDAWIADGNYHETLDLRLRRADTIVVLDMPWWLCSWRALLRGVPNAGRAASRM